MVRREGLAEGGAHPDGLGLKNPVFYPGMLAVPQIQPAN